MFIIQAAPNKLPSHVDMRVSTSTAGLGQQHVLFPSLTVEEVAAAQEDLASSLLLPAST
jgi:hypothetical protein